MPSTSRARIGLGTKIIWTQSQFVVEIIDQITGLGAERGDFDATHMDVPPLEPGQFANALKIPSEIARIPDMTYMAHLDEARAIPPIGGDPETIEIFFRRRKTDLTAAKLAGTGWLKSFSWTIPVENKATVQIVVAWTGNMVFTRPTPLS